MAADNGAKLGVRFVSAGHDWVGERVLWQAGCLYQLDRFGGTHTRTHNETNTIGR